VLLSAVAAGAQPSRAADDAAIRAQIAGYVEARHTGQGAAQAAYYTEDADSFLWGTRHMSKGRAQIAQDMTVHDPDPALLGSFRIVIESIDYVGPDVAAVDGQYYAIGPEPRGHSFYLMVKRDGRWLIRSARVGAYPRPAPSSQK
jgi:uncharacterized protein (TIGR02246 family)